MLQNSILLQNLDVEQLTTLMENVLIPNSKTLKRVKYKNRRWRPDDKTGSFGITQINASTLWHYQKGRITVYKFSNKCFYKSLK
jgi:hypothetical protein